MPGMPRVIVMGGSVGGLTAALVLRDVGCEVRVFERSSAALQARGAGIAALDATLRYLTERGGRQRADVCSSTDWIRFLRPDGSILHEQRHRYLFSSWNTIYQSLLDLFDPGRYLLGREVTAFGQSGDSVHVTLADGASVEADLLVCADGVSSLARARLLGQRSAPGHVTRVGRPDVRQQPRPGQRTHAVGAHQQVSFGAGAIRERDQDRVPGLAERGDLAAEQVAAGVEQLEQRGVDGVPRREQVAVPLLVKDAAIGPQEPDPVGGGAHVGPLPTAPLGQVTQGGVEGGDARAAGLQRSRRSLEDPDLAADVAEHERGGQAAYRAAHDDDAGHSGHRLWSFRSAWATAARTWPPSPLRARTGPAARRSRGRAGRRAARCLCTSPRSGQAGR